MRSLLPLLVLSLPAAAQSAWVRQAQLPTWKNSLAISAPADDEYFAIAGALFAQTGEVLHNVGGTHTDWSVQQVSNTTLNAVFFVDPLHGWAAGNGMFHTVDGGQTWVQDNTWGSMYDIFFLDAQTGWSAGNGGIVYRTTDGGATWAGEFAALGGTTARSVWFVDAQHGWAAGIGGKISESTDGGVTWTQVHSGSYLTTVQFFDALEGWGMGGAEFVHTTNGGTSWTPVALPTGSWIQSARFHDRMRGIGVGDGGNIVYTHDGGQSWTTARAPGSGPRLWDVEFSPSGQAVVSGDRGTLLRSDDFGVTWTPLQSGAAWTTRGMDFHDPNTGWVANEAGEIALTTDGGALWERVQVQSFDEYSDLWDIDFVDANVGWTVGQQQVFGLADDGRIARSDDGGRTWQLQFSQSGLEFFGVTAIDANTAIAYGRGNFANSAYLRTTDGGLNWSGAGNPNLVGTFRDAQFLDDGLTGWLVSEDIWFTTNGGATWTLQYDGGVSLACISMADALNGWASGFVNTLLRTTDGGQTWVAQDPGGPAGAAYMTVSAGGPNEAVVAGWEGFVARTTDGGATWVQETLPDLPALAAPLEWNASYMIDGENGWLAGSGGIYRRGTAYWDFGVSLCNGDGGDQLGCTDCPCGNQTPAGTTGGCLNSSGAGSRLSAAGSTSVSLPSDSEQDLRLTLASAPAGAFCVLLSGDAVAPQNAANPCFGLGSGVQSADRDGLRCAVQGVRRHGGRVADASGAVDATAGSSRMWGGVAGPASGLAVQGGFAAGQTRYFQVTHREDPAAVCLRGLNTSQAIEIPFVP